MHSITNWLQTLPAPAIYAVIAALVFTEDALFFGFVLPAETSVVIGGFLASQGTLSVAVLAVIVVTAAIVGDTVGYEVGRHFGSRILESRPLRAHRDRVDNAQDLIRRRGPVAVFLGRFVAFFRAMMPALAGTAGMRYRTFLMFNAVGGLLWGVGFVLLGYFAGAAYARIEADVGRGLAGFVAAVVIVAVVVWHFRRRRREREPDVDQTTDATLADKVDGYQDPN
jgi:membrane-associated protein